MGEYRRETIGGGNKGTLIHRAGAGRILVFSTDTTTNNVYLSTQQDVKGNGNYTTLRPLGTVVLDGTTNTYAATDGPNVVIELSPATSATPAPSDVAAQIAAAGLAKDTTVAQVNTTLGTPAQTNDIGALHSGGTIANEIASAGVPLLRKSVNLASASGQTLALNTTVTLYNGPIDSISYEFRVSLKNAATSNPGFGQVSFTWTDSVTGAVVDVVSFSFFSPISSASVAVIRARGPARADTVTITLSNQPVSTGDSMVYSFQLIGSSIVYTRDWISQHGLANSGGSNGLPSQHPDAYGMLAMESAAVPASGLNTYIMPFYAGPVQIAASTTSGLADAVFLVSAYDTSILPSANVIYIKETDSKGYLSDVLTLPRIQCLFSLQNLNGAQQTLTVAILPFEYPD